MTTFDSAGNYIKYEGELITPKPIAKPQKPKTKLEIAYDEVRNLWIDDTIKFYNKKERIIKAFVSRGLDIPKGQWIKFADHEKRERESVDEHRNDITIYEPINNKKIKTEGCS
jgi:hypothetical protein